MRKIFLLLFIPILLIGCKKDGAALLFDAAPEERMAQQLAELENKLLESEGAWKASLTTGTATAKNAYNFYIKFNNDNTCRMQGDLTNETASVWHETTYRIIWAMNASLLFDTFTYITMLQEPSNSYGGTAPHGYRSDIEFEYIRSTADSVILRGKKYSHELILTKVGPDAIAELDLGKYIDKVDESDEFFLENENCYFLMNEDGPKYSVSIDKPIRKITINWIGEDGLVKTASSNYAYSLDGLDIISPIDVNGSIFSKLDISGTSGEIVSTLNNSYTLLNNPFPIIPLSISIGYSYSNFFLDHNAIYPGTTGIAAEVLGRLWEYMPLTSSQAPPGRKRYWFNPATVTVRFNETTKAVFFDFRVSQNANSWTDTFRFNYVRGEDNSLTFTKVGGGSINYVDTDFAEWASHIDGQTYDVEFYADGGINYAKFTSRAATPFIFTLKII